jgi:abequosyltransferase
MADIRSNLLLSICIPTNGRKEILLNTLDSIFASGVEPSLYEVVIYDSSEDNELQKLIPTAYPFQNLIYKSGKNNGYLNLIEALNMGNGEFLKLHNDYSMLCKGALADLITLIKAQLKSKPSVFFSNGNLKNTRISEYSTFDEFLHNISFYSTWSTAFGIWKTHFDEIKHIEINGMFPHTSLLLGLTGKQPYLVYNDTIFDNQEVSKKGGYNLFETFGVTFLNMLERCLKKGLISKLTFEYIKSDMMNNFLIIWYCDTKILKNSYVYDLSNIKSSIQVHYSTLSYYKMVLYAYILALRKTVSSRLK